VLIFLLLLFCFRVLLVVAEPLEGPLHGSLDSHCLEVGVGKHASVDLVYGQALLGRCALVIGLNEELVEGLPFILRKAPVFVDVCHGEYFHYL